VVPTYVMFSSKQSPSRYVPISELQGELADDVEVMVVEVDGDACAFPSDWIIRAQVAGESVVMTYCALFPRGRL
jgi:Protein of unknown function (DUF3179)